MMFRKLAVTAAVLAGAMVLPAIAMAADAFTTGNVNVRSGPGTGYAKVGMLREGARVDLRGCEGNWCNVYGPRLRGWVSANYLSDYVGRPPAVIVAPTIVVRPPHYRPPHWNRPPNWNRPPKPRPPRPRPPGAHCKIAPGFPCPR